MNKEFDATSDVDKQYWNAQMTIPYLKSEYECQKIKLKSLGIDIDKSGGTFEQCINTVIMMAADYKGKAEQKQVSAGVWVKASERKPESKIWRVVNHKHGTHSINWQHFVMEDREYYYFSEEKYLKTNVEWLEEKKIIMYDSNSGGV